MLAFVVAILVLALGAVQLGSDAIFARAGEPASLPAHLQPHLGVAIYRAMGRISQAPSWMQDRGLEWTYRIAQEPRRLLPRYLYYNPRFLAAFARQYLGERRRSLGRSSND